MIKKILVSLLFCGIACAQFNGIRPPLGAQLDPAHRLTKGLVGAWFNQEAAPALGTLRDLSLNGNDGTLVGDTYSVSGPWGPVLDFDGTGDYVEMPSNIVKTADNFTVSLWFKADATDFAHHLIWEGVSGQNGWGSGTGGSSFQEFHISLGDFPIGVAIDDKLSLFLGDDDEDSSNPILASIDFSDTQNWHNVVGVFSGLSSLPTGDLYLDGVLVDSDTGVLSDTGRDSWDDNLRIGRPGADIRFFNGQISDVLIYNRALNAGEIKELFRDQYQMFKQSNIALIVAVDGAPAEEYTHTFIMMTALPGILILGLVGTMIYYGRKAA